MTSASELFYTRRSRIGRSCQHLGLDSSLYRSFPHNNHSNRRHLHQHQNHNNNNNNNNNHHSNKTRRDRHDLDGCDPLRRAPLIRHQSHRASTSECETVQHDEGSSQSSSDNIINLDNSGGLRNSPRISGNDRLPGAVLLARERLLERLRGLSLSRNNRQSNRAPSGINPSDLAFGDDFRLVDAGDWETDISREWLGGGTVFSDLVSQREQLLVSQETGKRPPGLTQEALNCLQVEVFSKAKYSDEGKISQECSICLESFVEGDELICLPCAHGFHSSCLDPWVRTCGDCPYCRRGIREMN